MKENDITSHLKIYDPVLEKYNLYGTEIKPGYVFKALTEEDNSSKSIKLFFNIVYPNNVRVWPINPVKNSAVDLLNQFSFRRVMENPELVQDFWDTPLGLVGFSAEKPDKDQKGNPCLVFDAVVDQRMVFETIYNKDLRVFLVHKIILDFIATHTLSINIESTSFPKIIYKGENNGITKKYSKYSKPFVEKCEKNNIKSSNYLEINSNPNESNTSNDFISLTKLSIKNENNTNIKKNPLIQESNIKSLIKEIKSESQNLDNESLPFVDNNSNSNLAMAYISSFKEIENDSSNPNISLFKVEISIPNGFSNKDTWIRFHSNGIIIQAPELQKIQNLYFHFIPNEIISVSKTFYDKRFKMYVLFVESSKSVL